MKMQSLGVQVVFAVVLITAAPVKADNGGATFRRKTVTLTCPESGDWFEDAKKLSNVATEYTFDYQHQGRYSCKYDDKTYTFYVKGKVCDNCFELDGLFFMLVIVVDLTATSFLMMMIYSCSKKNTSDAPARTPKAPVKSGGLGPHVPSPDYESLNLNTLSADTYSTVVNRMG
ncbi:T-cell surface glycoprotein CD3 epsilon chain-like [Nematolebias whitei]|uniref:T-cell surface glycoprotein CD3 epsilon chain-like n=1 Tax=Nematolebias whitei TaxID=451745 RepID=UPI00189B9FDF|nr:T-cell surface glycoprotein CD3 epsilon chain-like [Nematolebias whitei]